MLRFILDIFAALLIVLTSFILIPINLLVGLFSKRKKELMAQSFLRIALKSILFISGTSVTIIGKEKLDKQPKDEVFLFIGNHNGFFDVMLTYTNIKCPLSYLSKKEFAKVPFMHYWMKAGRSVFIDRAHPREGLKSILEGVEVMKSGTSMFVFPEGTRNRTGEGLLDFHSGCFKLAEKTNCKIFPVVMNNTAECFENALPHLHKTHTVLEFLDPIDISNLNREERKKLNVRCRELMLNCYEKNKSLV